MQEISCLSIADRYIRESCEFNSFFEGIKFVELKLRLFWSVAVISFFGSIIWRRFCQIFNTSKNSKLVSFIREKKHSNCDIFGEKIELRKFQVHPNELERHPVVNWTQAREGRLHTVTLGLHHRLTRQVLSLSSKICLPSEWCDSPFYSHNWHRSGLDDEIKSDPKNSGTTSVEATGWSSNVSPPSMMLITRWQCSCQADEGLFPLMCPQLVCWHGSFLSHADWAPARRSWHLTLGLLPPTLTIQYHCKT